MSNVPDQPKKALGKGLSQIFAGALLGMPTVGYFVDVDAGALVVAYDLDLWRVGVDRRQGLPVRRACSLDLPR